MDLNDWILALHLLSAFALVATLVLFSILIVAGWNVDTPGPTVSVGRVARVGNVAVAIGMGGTILFGIWLAISLDAYQVWDGWVIAAIVLWGIAGATGGVTGKEYTRVFERAKELDAAGQTGRAASSGAEPHLPRAPLSHRDLRGHGSDPDRHDLEAGRMTDFALFVHVFGR